MTVTIEDGAKYRQALPFASPEQINLYNRLRQGTEGVHGTAKDEAKVALANPGRRRVRGWAALQVFTAFLLAETATQRIITFLKNAVERPRGPPVRAPPQAHRQPRPHRRATRCRPARRTTGHRPPRRRLSRLRTHSPNHHPAPCLSDP